MPNPMAAIRAARVAFDPLRRLRRPRDIPGRSLRRLFRPSRGCSLVRRGLSNFSRIVSSRQAFPTKAQPPPERKRAPPPQLHVFIQGPRDQITAARPNMFGSMRRRRGGGAQTGYAAFLEKQAARALPGGVLRRFCGRAALNRAELKSDRDMRWSHSALKKDIKSSLCLYCRCLPSVLERRLIRSQGAD